MCFPPQYTFKSINQINPIFIISVLTKISLLVGSTIPNKSNAVRVRCHWTPTMSSYKLCIFKTQDGFEPFRQTTKIFLYPFIYLLRVSLIARDETWTHNNILYVMEKNFAVSVWMLDTFFFYVLYQLSYPSLFISFVLSWTIIYYHTFLFLSIVF